MREVLEKNKLFFEDFEKAVQSPYFQDPVFSDPASFGIDLPFLSFGQYRTFAKLNLLHSIYLFKQGKEKEAFDETIKVIKIGQMFQDSPLPSLIQYLSGIAIKGMGLERLRAMVKETNLLTDLLKSYASELGEFYAYKESLAKILKGEYISLKNTKTKFLEQIVKEKKISKEEKISIQEIFPSDRVELLSRFFLFLQTKSNPKIFC